MSLARDSDFVEINDAPYFNYGDKVRAKRAVKNDGTFRGKDIGDYLCRKGDEGYVVSIGTFLQQFYIYGVEFIETGNVVGMKLKELASVDDDEEPGLEGGET
jgi:nitrogen fixation protein NifZ